MRGRGAADESGPRALNRHYFVGVGEAKHERL